MYSLEFHLINLVTNVNLGLVIDVENCIWLQKKKKKKITSYKLMLPQDLDMSTILSVESGQVSKC